MRFVVKLWYRAVCPCPVLKSLPSVSAMPLTVMQLWGLIKKIHATFVNLENYNFISKYFYCPCQNNLPWIYDNIFFQSAKYFWNALIGIVLCFPSNFCFMYSTVTKCHSGFSSFFGREKWTQWQTQRGSILYETLKQALQSFQYKI